MPCNLAVSITKAAVSDAHMAALLTDETVRLVVGTYLQQQYAANTPQPVAVSTGVAFTLGDVRVAVERGQIRVTTGAWPSSADRQLVAQLTDELTDLRLNPLGVKAHAL